MLSGLDAIELEMPASVREGAHAVVERDADAGKRLARFVIAHQTRELRGRRRSFFDHEVIAVVNANRRGAVVHLCGLEQKLLNRGDGRLIEPRAGRLDHLHPVDGASRGDGDLHDYGSGASRRLLGFGVRSLYEFRELGRARQPRARRVFAALRGDLGERRAREQGSRESQIREESKTSQRDIQKQK